MVGMNSTNAPTNVFSSHRLPPLTCLFQFADSRLRRCRLPKMSMLSPSAVHAYFQAVKPGVLPRLQFVYG